MTRLQTLAEAERFLLQYSPLKMGGETYTTDRMVKLMNYLGNPQNAYPVVHIAGTSGKTSTSYFIRNLLEQAGKRTGLTVSPHIETITERVQIGGSPIDDGKFVEYLNEFLECIAPSKLEPTYHELLIALAYWVFAKEKVDYAVIETGLGGLLDSTNVVSRRDKLCVITPIGFDHTQVLGETLEAIATQKAGIIGESQLVFSAAQDDRAAMALNMAAKEQSTKIEYVEKADDSAKDLPLFQRQNWQLAKRVYTALEDRDSLEHLSPTQLGTAMSSMPPGRFERYTIGDVPVLLDGAHNAQKLSALIASLPTEFRQGSTWLVALVQSPDTKIEACADEMAKVGIGRLLCTEFTQHQDIKYRQSISASKFVDVALAKQLPASAIESIDDALQAAIQEKRPVVITGSLYLVSAIRPKLLAMTR